MRTLFLQLFEISVAGGIAAALVLAVSALLKRLRAPARLSCLLWGVAALRFVLPGGVIPFYLPRPHSAAVQEVISSVQAAQAAPAVTQGAAAAGAAAQAAPGTGMALSQAAGSGFNFTIWHFLAAVWAIGSAVLILRAAASYLRLKRSVALSCKTDDGCYTCAAVTAPFTLGLLRPRIYMPESLQGSARYAVLLHERTHIARHDPLTKPLVYLVACLHWWNPLAWLTFAQFERTMENACDEAATRGGNAAERVRYCESILQFAQRRTVPGSLSFGQGSVKARISHVLHYRHPGRAAVAVCAAVALLAATACMAKPEIVIDNSPAAVSTTAESAAAVPAAAEAPTATNAPAATEAPAGDDDDIGRSLDLIAINDYAFAEKQPSPEFAAPLDSYNYISALYSAQVDGLAHYGDDLAADIGTPVYAVADGVVGMAEYDSSYGNHITIAHGKSSDGAEWESLYAGLDSMEVSAGQSVARGQQIGTVGTTGLSTGAHLHIELHRDGVPVSPSCYILYNPEQYDATLIEQGADGGGAASTAQANEAAAAEATPAPTEAASLVQADEAAEADAKKAADEAASLVQADEAAAMQAAEAAAEEAAAADDANYMAATIAAGLALGADRAATESGTAPSFICPLASYAYISREFGSGHKGLDFVADTGTPVYAAADGVVDIAEWFNTYGNYVMLYHEGGINSIYAHLDTITVKQGQRVKQGEQIGTVGNTGNSTGAHLHLEIYDNSELSDPASYVGTEPAAAEVYSA